MPQTIQKATTDATGGTTSTGVVPVNHIGPAPQPITVNIVVTGVATLNVEYSMDDTWPAGTTEAGMTWAAVPNATGLNTSATVVVTFPVKAIRVTQTAGAGSSVVKILQARG